MHMHAPATIEILEREFRKTVNGIPIHKRKADKAVVK
jgi:cobyric acid synthase